jgi:hypothetical protein
MRLLVHRGQALLLLLVGGLAGAAVAAATLEWDVLPAPVAARATGFLVPSRGQLPVRIEIGRPGRPSPDSSVVAATQTDPGPVVVDDTASSAPAARSVQPSPPTTVVPATVYAYPPSDQGRRGPGDGGSGGGPGRGGRG